MSKPNILVARAVFPEVITHLHKLGFTVAVETGAGRAANFTDDAYKAAGAEIINDTKSLW